MKKTSDNDNTRNVTGNTLGQWVSRVLNSVVASNVPEQECVVTPAYFTDKIRKVKALGNARGPDGLTAIERLYLGSM